MKKKIFILVVILGLIFQANNTNADCPSHVIGCYSGFLDWTFHGNLFKGEEQGYCQKTLFLLACDPCDYSWDDLTTQCNNTYSSCSGKCTALTNSGASNNRPLQKIKPRASSDSKLKGQPSVKR